MSYYSAISGLEDMAKVNIAVMHSDFTNHRIRIVRKGEPYPFCVSRRPARVAGTEAGCAFPAE
jgi:hypothetical protein